MIKRKTLELINTKDVTYRDLFSICIGNAYTCQNRFIEFLGKYSRWDTDVKEGILKLDDRIYDVEYIGSTSKFDNFWCSSELENVIPDRYVKLMINIRKTMESVGLEAFTKGKILLGNGVTGYNLSMIYIAFSPENVAYFNGAGDVSIYMFVKNLPDSIFRKINSTEFSTRVMEIISTFDVNHRLMVKALLTENNIEYQENENSVVAKFNEKSIITVKFKNGLIEGLQGTM